AVAAGVEAREAALPGQLGGHPAHLHRGAAAGQPRRERSPCPRSPSQRSAVSGARSRPAAARPAGWKDGGMAPDPFVLRPIGTVRSPLTERSEAPKQGFEGSPEAWLVLDPGLRPAYAHPAAGQRVIVLTWFDRAARDVLRVHPRDDLTAPERGVFSTRSPDRPNPIGLHPVEIVAVEGDRVRVRDLEALDGTPVLDLKPVLDGVPNA